VLTLIVTPAMLMLIDQWRQKRIRWSSAIAAWFARPVRG